MTWYAPENLLEYRENAISLSGNVSDNPVNPHRRLSQSIPSKTQSFGGFFPNRDAATGVFLKRGTGIGSPPPEIALGFSPWHFEFNQTWDVNLANRSSDGDALDSCPLLQQIELSNHFSEEEIEHFSMPGIEHLSPTTRAALVVECLHRCVSFRGESEVESKQNRQKNSNRSQKIKDVEGKTRCRCWDLQSFSSPSHCETGAISSSSEKRKPICRLFSSCSYLKTSEEFGGVVSHLEAERTSRPQSIRFAHDGVWDSVAASFGQEIVMFPEV